MVLLHSAMEKVENGMEKVILLETLTYVICFATACMLNLILFLRVSDSFQWWSKFSPFFQLISDKVISESY